MKMSGIGEQPGAPVGDHPVMASIQKSVRVAASPEHAWSALRDFGAVHTRLAPGFVVATELDTPTSCHCRFVWSADLLPDEFSAAVDAMMATGLAAMKKALEATA